MITHWMNTEHRLKDGTVAKVVGVAMTKPGTINLRLSTNRGELYLTPHEIELNRVEEA